MTASVCDMSGQLQHVACHKCICHAFQSLPVSNSPWPPRTKTSPQTSAHENFASLLPSLYGDPRRGCVLLADRVPALLLQVDAFPADAVFFIRVLNLLRGTLRKPALSPCYRKVPPRLHCHPRIRLYLDFGATVLEACRVKRQGVILGLWISQPLPRFFQTQVSHPCKSALPSASVVQPCGCRPC